MKETRNDDAFERIENWKCGIDAYVLFSFIDIFSSLSNFEITDVIFVESIIFR